MDEKDLDARGLLCPLPVLKVAKRLKSMSVGEEIRLIADDPAAVVDVPHFCAESGHHLVGSEDQGQFQIYTIEKGQLT